MVNIGRTRLWEFFRQSMTSHPYFVSKDVLRMEVNIETIHVSCHLVFSTLIGNELLFVYLNLFPF